METHYSVLDCDENSSFEEIKRKYQELALKYHPDKAIIACEKDRQKFIQINQAWSVLREPESRLKYNATLKYLDSVNCPLIYMTLEFKDLEYDEKENVYSYPCRCGGFFQLEKKDLIPPEFLVECDDCSFSLLVKVS